MIRLNQNSFINVKAGKYMAHLKTMTDEQMRYKTTQDFYTERIAGCLDDADDIRNISAILEEEKNDLVDQL